MDSFYRINSTHRNLMIIYLYHDEQYRELEVTALRHKKRHSECRCGRMRRTINARSRTCKRELEAGRIKSHYPEGAIPAPTGLYFVSRIFPRPCVRRRFSKLYAQIAKYSGSYVCLSPGWVDRPRNPTSRNSLNTFRG